LFAVPLPLAPLVPIAICAISNCLDGIGAAIDGIDFPADGPTTIDPEDLIPTIQVDASTYCVIEDPEDDCFQKAVRQFILCSAGAKSVGSGVGCAWRYMTAAALCAAKGFSDDSDGGGGPTGVDFRRPGYSPIE
jgi:hypothetical protein